MKLSLALVCQNVVTDAASNLISYINCLWDATIEIDRVGEPSPPMVIAAVWSRDEETEEDHLRIRVRFRLPSGRSKTVFESGEIDFPKRNLRTNLTVAGVPLLEEGQHYVILDMRRGDRWRKMAEMPFRITLSQPEEVSGLG